MLALKEKSNDNQTINVFAKFHDNLSNNYLGISVWTKVVEKMIDIAITKNAPKIIFDLLSMNHRIKNSIKVSPSVISATHTSGRLPP